MASKPPIRVNSLEEIPFDTMDIDREYHVPNATAEMLEEARDRLAASPRAFGRRPKATIVHGVGATMRVVIWPHNGKLSSAVKPPPGRPVGALSMKLGSMGVGGYTIVPLAGTSELSVRVNASRLGKQCGRKFSCGRPQQFDSRLDWTKPPLAGGKPEDFLMITRKT